MSAWEFRHRGGGSGSGDGVTWEAVLWLASAPGGGGVLPEARRTIVVRASTYAEAVEIARSNCAEGEIVEALAEARRCRMCGRAPDRRVILAGGLVLCGACFPRYDANRDGITPDVWAGFVLAHEELEDTATVAARILRHAGDIYGGQP